MQEQLPIILVGGGRMGQALLGGWLKSGIPSGKITVIEPSAECSRQLHEISPAHPPVRVLATPSSLSPSRSIIVFAVKPQQMSVVLPEYRAFTEKNALFLSIAAGKTLSYLNHSLGEQAAIVRAMPNLSATIGEGVTVLCANARVSLSQKELASTLCQSVGITCWIDNESYMDAVTAVSGSGPAYLFYFTECFIEGAKQLGLPADLAKLLALQTVTGSAALLSRSHHSPTTLREQVTSPKGTTEAALQILMAPGFDQHLKEAMKAAAKRSQELAE